MELPNSGIFDPVPYQPGYVTKDGMWAAVPWGNKFVIIHNGEQIHTSITYKSARDYIEKKLKSSKKKSSSTLEQFI